MPDSPNPNEIQEQTNSLYEKLGFSERQEMVAKQFLKYCINKPKNIQEKTSQIIPFMDTVAEALIKSSENKHSIEIGVKTVQLYLQNPTAEYFGETLVRLEYLEEHEVGEMLDIKPREIEFGSFLVEQGLITQDQRDMAVIVQKRLFTISEVFQKVTQEKYADLDAEFIENMKNVVVYFQTTTREMEKTIDRSHPEDIQKTMGRLQNIIGETESSSHMVLDFVDSSFVKIDQIEIEAKNLIETKKDWEQTVPGASDRVLQVLNELRDINIGISNSQAIQDRVGQQLQKIIPVIEGFYNLLQDLAVRLRINIEKQETGLNENECVQDGYGAQDDNQRIQAQSDVDDLLSNLGL
jgi:chemotaxis regulatin CheY-phosphate phosphatase CheZ